MEENERLQVQVSHLIHEKDHLLQHLHNIPLPPSPAPAPTHLNPNPNPNPNTQLADHPLLWNLPNPNLNSMDLINPTLNHHPAIAPSAHHDLLPDHHHQLNKIGSFVFNPAATDVNSSGNLQQSLNSLQFGGRAAPPNGYGGQYRGPANQRPTPGSVAKPKTVRNTEVGTRIYLKLFSLI